MVDVEGPAGVGFSAVGTGRVRDIDAPGDGVQARQRQVAPLVELRAPFTLSREEIDDVARGAQDADWQPVKDAARQIAFAEDGAIFEGYAAADIEGIRKGASNPPVILPADAKDYPAAIAQALSQLRVAGVDGPYSVLLSADAYTEVSETSDHGYPVIEHIKRLLTGDIIWAPAISGAIVLTTRGGDFSLHLGQDLVDRLPLAHRHRGQPVPAGVADVPDAHQRGGGGLHAGRVTRSRPCPHLADGAP